MPAAVSDTRRAIIALLFMAALGIALVLIFPGSPEQDTGYHFLKARAAWTDHCYFVGVWERPIFTTLFAIADLMGFRDARFLGIAIGLATAWQAWRLARDLKLERAWLVIPLLLAEPVFFELYPDMLTEPLFGLLFVIALRWHLRGWTRRAMLLASFLPLARPEGFFLGVLWGVWVLAAAAADRNSPRPLLQKIIRAIPSTLILLTGSIVWWLAAFWISGDPLYIKHTWPATWHQDMYGRGNIFNYATRAPEFLGILFIIPFLIGLWKCFRPSASGPRLDSPFVIRHSSFVISSSVLLLFTLHSIFRLYGLFGEAGYPRYMVSVSSAVAIITLLGWNTIAARLAAWPRTGIAIACAIFTLSLAQCFLYLDCLYWWRDAIAVNDMAAWLRDHPVTRTRLYWCNAYMCIALGENIDTAPPFTAQGADALTLLRNSPHGTLIFWDDHLGIDWCHLTVPEIESCGYQVLQSRHYVLDGVTGRDPIGRKRPPFEVQVTLLFKK